MRISNNIHQIPCLDETELLESWNEDEKIAIKKPVAPPAAPVKESKGKKGKNDKKEEPTADADLPKPSTEQDYEIKERVKSTTHSLKFET